MPVMAEKELLTESVEATKHNQALCASVSRLEGAGNQREKTGFGPDAAVRK